MSQIDGPSRPQHAPNVGSGNRTTGVGYGPGKETQVQRSEASAPTTLPRQTPTGVGATTPRTEAAVTIQGGTRVARLIELVTTTPDGAEFDDALAYLNAMSMPDMLATIAGAAECGFLQAIVARLGGAGAYDQARLLSAVGAVQLAGLTASSVTPERLNEVGIQLDQISANEQLAIYSYLLHRRGISLAVTTLLEGVIAMRNAGAAGGAGSPDATADPQGAGTGSRAESPAAGTSGVAGASMGGAPAPVEPGPWGPPGDQPIPFYIGNEAHKAIALEYVLANPADTIRTNNFPISSILNRLTAMGHAEPPNPGDSEHGLAPDIVNLSRLCLYEIKPEAAQAVGAAKAAMYLGVFSKAGIAMTLGPSGAPGTMGGVPAPGGVFMFWSPQPGVIVYQYRKGRLVPVPVPEPEPVRVRRWRFELKPLTRDQQQAVVTTTIGGAMLIVLMLALSPLGI